MAARAAETQALCTQLYESCIVEGYDHLFTQGELVSLNVIPKGDLTKLAECLNELLRTGLFKLMTRDGQSCYKIVPRENAGLYKDLNEEEQLVLDCIESAGREGIWIKNIRARTNLHQNVAARAVKALESKNLIKQTHAARGRSSQKVYILKSLLPSEESTGGVFYSEGVVDEEFVHHLLEATARFVANESWRTSEKSSPKRQKSRGLIDAESVESRKKRMPPGYTHYPTTSKITHYLNDSMISNVLLKEEEVQKIVDVLMYDGRLEKAPGVNGYKAVRPSGEHPYGNNGNIGNIGDVEDEGVAQAPCAQCPVFDLCDDSGPVNPRSCQYFQDWLKDGH